MFLSVAQRLVLKDAAGAGETSAPQWQLLLPLGARHHAAYGKIDLSKSVLETMERNFKAEAGRRAVNYFHRGGSNVPAPIEQKIAAGWIEDVEYREAPSPGLYALIKFNDKARGHILADEISYLSAEFDLKSKSKLTGKEQGPMLTGAALLNDPFITEAAAIAASETGATVNPEILKALGLSEGADDAAILAAVLKQAEQSVKFTEGTVKLAEVEARATAAEAKALRLSEQVESLTLEKRTAEVTAFTERMVKELRLTPAARPGVEKLALAHGLEAIKFLESQAPSGSTTERGVAGVSEVSDPKADAFKRFTAKRDELVSKGCSFMEAQRQTQAALPEDYALAFAAK